MVRRALFALSAVFLLLLAPAAHAGRAKIPALEPAKVLAEPKEDAAVVVEIKKGDELMVLGKRGDWSQVLTNGGKKGWVPNKVVTMAGLDSLDASSMEVAAAEGDTALAIRARPNPPRTVVVAMGGLDASVAQRIGDLLREKSGLRIVDVRAEAGTKPGSPAGGLDGAVQLGAAKKAEVVIAVQAAAGDALAYEVVDLRGKTVLVNATTEASTDERAGVEQVAAAVESATEKLAKNPAAEAESKTEAKAESTPAEAKATPAPTTTPEPRKKKPIKRGLRLRK